MNGVDSLYSLPVNSVPPLPVQSVSASDTRDDSTRSCAIDVYALSDVYNVKQPCARKRTGIEIKSVRAMSETGKQHPTHSG